MYAMSPQLSKMILAFLLLFPAFSLYLKILWPYLAQTGFEGAIIVACEIVFILFISVFNTHPKISRDAILLISAIACWHLLGLISAIISDHFHASLIKQIEYAIHCIFAYSVWIFLSQIRKTEKMTYFLIFTLLWVIYYILAAWHSNSDAFQYDWVHGTPMFNNIRHLGFFQIGILPLLFFPLLSERRHKHVITLVLLSVFWASVIWSSSRGTFLGAIIISILLALFFSRQRKTILLASLITLLIGWLIALQFPSESPSLNPYRLLFLNFGDTGNLTSNQLSSGRTTLWLTTLSHMWQHSALFGFAADGYQYVDPHIWPDTVQPHSGPVQLLSEFGILGFSCLLYIMFICIKLWHRHPGSINNKLARFSLLAIAIGSLIDGHFYHTFSLLLICFLLALSFSEPKETIHSKSSKTKAFAILLVVSLFIWPIQQHWQTYIVQQFSLTDKSQLEQVKKFPSYYFPMSWLYGHSNVLELRHESIKLGQKNGPRRCNYYLMEYLDSQDKRQKTRLLNSLKETCTKSELNRSKDNILMALSSEAKR